MITESPELKGNLMNASQELNNLRYSSTKENKDNSDSEEELKPAKRRHGNSVYIHRPERTSAASIFEDNNLDSLRKKHLFIISQYERILRETSDLNKKIEDTTKKVEELTKSLKDIKEEKKKKQSDILNYLSNKESLQEIYKNKLNYIINRRNEMKSKFEDKEINLNLDQQKVQLENDNPLKGMAIIIDHLKGSPSGAILVPKASVPSELKRRILSIRSFSKCSLPCLEGP